MPPTSSERDASFGADERAALIAAHERREQALRDSAQYRLGALLLAARTPRRVLRLPREIWRLYKELTARHRVALPPASRQSAARPITAATVFDQFSHAAFEPEWVQRPLRPDDPAAQLGGCDLVIAESAWEGNGGAFRYEFAHLGSRDRSPVRKLTAAAREVGVPSVFWNKEDPVHFDTFLPAAELFDWVFTTDADCIPRYLDRLGHQRVAALPFAAQAHLHNPIGSTATRLPRACFAGSWQADHYAERGADIELLLRPALERGVLDIYDRMAAPGATGARFPAPYSRAVLGAKPYLELVAEYRRYACFLNVNSVRESPTMCSRRVFELLACRTPVISTPSRAIEELLGDAVITVDSPTAAAAALTRLLEDRTHWDAVAHRGYRKVIGEHTYGDRVDALLDTIGIASPPRTPRRVAVLAATNRPEFLDNIIANFTNQVGVDAELILLTNSAAFDLDRVDTALAGLRAARAIHLPPERTLGECLNAGLDATDARFVAKFDDDDFYAPHYLYDALLASRYSGAAIIGKKTFYAHLAATDETILRFPGNEFTPANRVSGSTLLIDREVFDTARFEPLNLGEDLALCEAAQRRGLTVFSSDRFNFAANRRGAAGGHSWNVGDDEYRVGSVHVGDGFVRDAVVV